MNYKLKRRYRYIGKEYYIVELKIGEIRINIKRIS